MHELCLLSPLEVSGVHYLHIVEELVNEDTHPSEELARGHFYHSAAGAAIAVGSDELLHAHTTLSGDFLDGPGLSSPAPLLPLRSAKPTGHRVLALERFR